MMVLVFLRGPNFNFSKTENRRTLTAAPKSSMTFGKIRSPNLQRIEKILVSLHFGGIFFFCKIAEIF